MEISFEAVRFQNHMCGSKLDEDFESDDFKRSRCALTCLST
jgi:hypothetical protein